MMKGIAAVQIDKETGRQKPINSVYMMSHSGARGSPAQMKQLAGMRGLMARPDGSIIETPITANFKEGLNVLEYFNSTHGARKGLADTALKTANSGYLTRRLVDVAQDLIITELDCGTERGLTMEAIVDAGQVVATLGQRILGRTTAEDIIHPETGKAIIEGQRASHREGRGRDRGCPCAVGKIRSPLTCDLRTGCCAACYGRDLARGTPVNIGEAVGVIAAQSIGEPGTQLTMRTFHIGGTAQVVDTSFLEAGAEGKIAIRNPNLAKVSGGRHVAMGRNVAIAILDPEGKDRSTHQVAYGAKLRINEGDEVKRGQRIAEWDPYTRPVLAEVDGEVAFEDLVDGMSVAENTDETTGFTKRVVIDWRTSQRSDSLKPASPSPARARWPRSSVAAMPAICSRWMRSSRSSRARRSRRATCSRVSRSRAPRPRTSPAVCRVWPNCSKPVVRRIMRSLPRSTARSNSAATTRTSAASSSSPRTRRAEPVEYLIPKGKPFHLQEGDAIEKGEYILDGNPAPHDILAIKGVEELARYLVNEIQEVYRLQGVLINDKHIEVIVRQMLQKVEIVDPGDRACSRTSSSTSSTSMSSTTSWLPTARSRRRPIRSCSASPRRRCRPGASSRPRPSRKPPASSPRRRFPARRTCSKASRRTSSSAASSRRAPVPRTPGQEIATKRDDLILEERRRQAETAAAIAAPVRPNRPNKDRYSEYEKGARGAPFFACCAPVGVRRDTGDDR